MEQIKDITKAYINKELRSFFEESLDKEDVLGHCVTWQFALCDFLTDVGVEIPAEYEFKQAPSGSNKTDIVYILLYGLYKRNKNGTIEVAQEINSILNEKADLLRKLEYIK